MKRLTFAALLLTCCTGLTLRADEPKTKSLDDQLLEDLTRDEPRVPAAQPEAKPTPAKAGADKPAPGGLDEQLLEQLEGGEDIELGPPKNPLIRIGERMRAAETLISRKDTSTRTQELQQQIVRDLDLLLEQTKKQCQGGQCPNPSSQAGNKPGSKSSTPKPGPTQAGDPGNQPAKDSTDRLGKPGENKQNDAAAMDQLVKEAWGHLPEKVRGQMQNVGVEQFLPKYEKLIEAYYKRLAEEENR